MHGRRDFLDQAIHCAEKFGIRHEILDTADIRKRFSQFAVTDERVYFEYETGFLRPELCIEAQLHLARKHGALIQTDESVVSIESGGDSGVTVKTSRGAYFAEKVIVSAGPWIGRFLPEAYADLFKVYRQVMYWFDIRENCRSTFAPPGFPFSFGSLGGAVSLVSTVFRPATAKRSRSRPSNSRRSPTRITCRGQVRHGRKTIHVQRLCPRPLPGISERCETAASCLYTVDARFELRHRRSPG